MENEAVTIKKTSSRGGLREGSGRPSDLIDASAHKVTLDGETVQALRALVGGNLSAGIRKSAQKEIIMKQIVGGKSYNTDTATYICDLECSSESPTDFRWHDSKLYKSPKGTFFVAGQGGPMSMWSIPVGSNGRVGCSGIKVVTEDEARMYMDDAKCDAEDFELAGLTVAEG